MKKRVVGITLVLVLLVGAGAAATFAVAEDWGRGRPGRHGGGRFGHGIMQMLRALELSDEQREQVGAAMMSARKKAIVARAQLHVARMELHEALFQDEVDSAAVAQHRDQVAALQGALLDSRIAAQQSIHRVLTPEQRSKARTLFLERMIDHPKTKSHGDNKNHHGRRHGRFHSDEEGGHGRGHGQQ